MKRSHHFQREKVVLLTLVSAAENGDLILLRDLLSGNVTREDLLEGRDEQGTPLFWAVLAHGTEMTG